MTDITADLETSFNSLNDASKYTYEIRAVVKNGELNHLLNLL